MGRARIFKKTLHYLWRDVRDFSIGIIIPAIAGVALFVLGMFLAAFGARSTVEVLEATPGDAGPLIIIPFIIYGALYYGVCQWIYTAYGKAQQAIYNENKELVNSIKDPK